MLNYHFDLGVTRVLLVDNDSNGRHAGTAAADFSAHSRMDVERAAKAAGLAGAIAAPFRGRAVVPGDDAINLFGLSADGLAENRLDWRPG